MAILLATCAAIAWGVSDFIGGLATRRISVITVLLLVESGGLAVILVVSAFVRPEGLDAAGTVMALGAGLAGVLGLGLFYKAMAIGTVSVVAPISSSGVAIPVAVGLLTGDRPSLAQSIGLVAIVAGVMLASREQSKDGAPADASRRALGLALLAAVCFGGFFALVHTPSEQSVVWTVMLVRLAPVPLIAALWLARGRERPPSRRFAASLFAVGSIDLAATTLVAAAATMGDVGIVAVLGSMYPVVTVMLAATVLRERVLPSQYAGVALALLGIAAVAGG